MSMKIYTGFKMKTTDIEEIYAHIQTMQKVVEEHSNKAIAATMAWDCASLYDKRTMDKTLDRTLSVYQVIFHEFNNRQMTVKQKQIKDPSVDYSMDVVLFPFEGEFYGMFYTVQSDFADLWYKSGLVAPFWYWNNTDPDENCTEAEWDERERVWDAIFEEQSIPAMRGFTFQISPELSLFTPSGIELEPFMPSIQERAKNYAKDKVYHDFVKNRKITQENVMKILRRFKEHTETEAGKQELARAEEDALKNLRLTITAVQLAETA
jgi:hypothetical protein